MTVGDRSQQLLAQPLRPQELLLLLARGAEAAPATGEGHENAPAALGAPQPGEAVLEEATLEELAQHPLDDRAQGAAGASEAPRPKTQQVLEVLFDQTEERRLTRPPWPIDAADNLHAEPEAGGRGTGGKGVWPSRSDLPTRD